jgi:hypothetical protein
VGWPGILQIDSVLILSRREGEREGGREGEREEGRWMVVSVSPFGICIKHDGYRICSVFQERT